MKEVLFISIFFVMVGAVAMIGIGRRFALSRTLGLDSTNSSGDLPDFFSFFGRTTGASFRYLGQELGHSMLIANRGGSETADNVEHAIHLF
jgi:hypothetical protein